MADTSWVPAVTNWVASVRQLAPGTLMAAVSLDEKAALAFEQHRVRVLRYCCGCSGLHAGPSFLLLKTSVTLALLEQGARVLFSEMDVFWRLSPMLLEDPRYDLQLSAHAHNAEVNIGLYIAQPRRAALLRALELMVRWAVDVEVQGCHDQKIWDHALSGNRRIYRYCFRHNSTGADLPLRAESLRDNRSAALKWVHIPYERLPHVFGGTQGCPMLPANASNHAVAVHAYGDVGPAPTERILLARLWGFWQLDHDAPHARNATSAALPLPLKLRNETLCEVVRRRVPDQTMRRFKFVSRPPIRDGLGALSSVGYIAAKPTG